MVELWVKLIMHYRKTLDQAPDHIREDVRHRLVEEGFLEDTDE